MLLLPLAKDKEGNPTAKLSWKAVWCSAAQGQGLVTILL